MPHTTVDLDPEQYERLATLAHASGQPLGELVRDVLGAYLASHAPNGDPNGAVPVRGESGVQPSASEGEDDWRRHLDDLRERARAGVPAEQLAGKSDRDLIADYLIRQGAWVVPAPPGPPSAEWRQKFQALLDQIHSRIPADLDPEEIEREITIASEEVRQERLRRACREPG